MPAAVLRGLLSQLVTLQTTRLSHPAGTAWRARADQARTVRLVGRLRSADETTGRKYPVFAVEDDNGKKQNVTVPPGYLQDIVKPYWGERVEVVAHRTQGRLELLDINPAEASE